MIRMLIFDLGNVLLRFHPRNFLLENGMDEPTASRILETIFRSEEWLLLDRGTIAIEEATSAFCRREPELSQPIRWVMDNWMGMMHPVDEIADLLPLLKERGYRLYYLSNMAKASAQYILEHHRVMDRFSGGVFSCDEGVIKPDPALYRALLDQYRLDPAQCLFLDDLPANVAGGEAMGIPSVLVEDHGKTAEFLKGLPDLTA